MWDWIIQYWAQALFGIILTAIVAIIKTEWNKIKAIGKGTQSLLRAELIRSGEKYIERGWIEVMPKMLMTNAISHIITSGKTAQWTICTRRSWTYRLTIL